VTHFIAIGIGAGLVSALLTAVVTQGSVVAFVLYLLSPIPILVAALGWDHRAGLVGAATGGLALAVGVSGVAGLGFALASALPAWWLAYLALLSRTAPDGSVEWYPLGRLLAWIAAVAALTFLAAIAVPHLDFEAYRQTAREVAELALRAQTATPQDATIPPIGGVPAEDAIDQFTAILPVVAAAGFVLVYVTYLWLGARIVAISGRLERPWPTLSATALPREALIALAIAGFAPLVLSGFLGVFATALAAALFMAFGLTGLAFVHDVSRGRSGRFLLLFGTYALLILSQFLVFVALAIVGIADTAFNLRDRFFSTRPPTITRKPPKE